MEAHGVPSKQAEAITSAITEVLNDSLENVAHSFVSKSEMQKVSFCFYFFLRHELSIGNSEFELIYSCFLLEFRSRRCSKNRICQSSNLKCKVLRYFFFSWSGFQMKKVVAFVSLISCSDYGIHIYILK